MTNSGTPRTALVFAAFLAVGVGIAAVFAPRLIDLRALAPTIAAELSNKLGQRVSIRGDIFLSFAPSPQLILRDVATKPLDDGMLALSVGEIQADLSWADLLLGQYTIDTLNLKRPTIDIRWAGITSIGVGFPQITVDHAQVRLHGASGVRVVEAVDAKIASASNGSITWALSGVLEGLPFNMDGKLSAPLKGNTRNGQLTLKLPEADVSIGYSGAVSSSDVKGRLTVSALRAADVVSLMNVGQPDLTRWPWSTQKMSIVGDVEANAEKISLNNADVALGEQTARLTSTLNLAAHPNFSVSVELSTIDPGLWLPSALASRQDVAVQRFSIGELLGVREWKGDVKINGAGLRMGEQTLRDLAIDLARDHQSWALRNAAVTLPGQARLSVAGLWVPESDDSSSDGGFDGSWRADVQNVRGLLSSFGIENADVPEGRLSSLAASGLVQTNDKLTVLSDLALSFDATQAKGRIAFGWDKSAPFSVDLDIDRLALDAYAPLFQRGLNWALGLTASPNLQPSGYGVTALAPWLGNFTAQRGTVRLAVPQLTWRDALAGRLGIDIAFGAGVMDIRSIAFEDGSGAAAWMGGKVKNLDSLPTAESLQFDIKLSDVARFARTARLNIPPPLRALAPWSVTGAINGSLVDATIAIDGKLGPVNAKARGKASIIDQSKKLEMVVEAAHPNVLQLRDMMWGAVKFPAKIDGPATASAKFKLDDKKISIADIAVAVGRHHFKGVVELDDSASPRMVNATLTDIDMDFTVLSPVTIFPIPRPGSWQGEVSLAGAAFKSLGFDAGGFKARFVAVPGSVELAEWQGKLYGGPAQVGLKWAKVPDEAKGQALHHVQGQVVINGADPSLMIDGLAASSKAQADLTLSFSAAASSPQGWLKELAGAGTAKLSLPANASTKAAGLMAPLAAIARAESPGGQVAAQIDSSASFAIASGVVAVKDLTMQSNAYNGLLNGSVDLTRQTFDLKGMLKLRDRGMIVGPTAQLVLRPNMPITISGAMDAPTIKLDVSGAQR